MVERNQRDQRLALRNQQRTVLNTGTAPTMSGNQSSPQQSVSTQPTVDPEVDQRIAQPHSIDQQDQQHIRVSYSRHPILGLEGLVGDLSDRDARIASFLFGLVREDHVRSSDHVEELSGLFAPARERLDGVRAVLEQKRVAFDEAENDVLRYEAFVGELDEVDLGNAQALLHLFRSNLKDKLEFARQLVVLFAPLKQRNMDEHTAASTHRNVFEKLDKAVNHNVTDAPQPR